MTLHVTICACTFRRPHLLPALLQSLAQQRVDFGWSVVIVDNDADGSARATVLQHAADFPVPLRYLVEPRRGISHARNTAVAQASGDYVAFIDDDETASPAWLAALVRTAIETDCDAVLGPVLPIFPAGSVAWAKDCGLYHRPRHATGARVAANEGRTSNALVKFEHLIGGEIFDPQYGLTGGEDYDFFRRLDARGGVIRWADDAIVSESVPLDRQRVRWVVERSLRGATGYWRMQNQTAPLALALLRAAAGLMAGSTFAVLAVLAWPVSAASGVRCFARAAKGFGRVLALTGVRIETYRHA